MSARLVFVTTIDCLTRLYGLVCGRVTLRCCVSGLAGSLSNWKGIKLCYTLNGTIWSVSLAARM